MTLEIELDLGTMAIAWLNSCAGSELVDDDDEPHGLLLQPDAADPATGRCVQRLAGPVRWAVALEPFEDAHGSMAALVRGDGTRCRCRWQYEDKMVENQRE